MLARFAERVVRLVFIVFSEFVSVASVVLAVSRRAERLEIFDSSVWFADATSWFTWSSISSSAIRCCTDSSTFSTVRLLFFLEIITCVVPFVPVNASRAIPTVDSPGFALRK